MGLKNAVYFHNSEVLEESEIFPQLEYCPICLQKTNRIKVHPIQTSPPIDMLYCGFCGGSSASHMPKSVVLEKYYERYYDNSKEMVTFHNIHRLAKHILEYVKPSFLFSKCRVLDFGGGDGSLGRFIAKDLANGNNGCELEVINIDYADSEGFENDSLTYKKFDSLDGLSGKFDVVLASGILEHIPNLNRVLQQLFQYIKEGGFFYARTPYFLPLTKIQKNIDLGYPGHVHDLGCLFWSRIIEILQLDVEIIKSQPSIVETNFKLAPIRTLVAYLLKFPAKLELFLTRSKRDIFWKYVGGWEIILRNTD